jgi:hypothetical protein
MWTATSKAIRVGLPKPIEPYITTSCGLGDRQSAAEFNVFSTEFWSLLFQSFLAILLFLLFVIGTSSLCLCVGSMYFLNYFYSVSQKDVALSLTKDLYTWTFEQC